MSQADLHGVLAVTFDLDSEWARAVVTALVAAVVLLVAWLLGRGARRAFDDPQQSYNARRLIRTAAWLVWFIGLVVIWRPLGGNLAPALGLATAGLAFAMQEVVGAIAGWFNITFGSIFRVGDRVQMGGVHGDVIDVSLLKTRLMEIGSPDGSTWVKGSQFTGRVVTVSNKASFTEPVFNYSSYFEFIWEEVEVAIPHHGDWEQASVILEREARLQSASEGARQAMSEARRRFPVPMAEVEPRVFASADQNFMRLAVRFVVPIRSARTVKDDMVRRVHTSLQSAGVEIISTSVVQAAATEWQPISRSDSASPGDPNGHDDRRVR